MHTKELDIKYSLFRAEVKERGLTKRTYGYYAVLSVSIIVGFILSVAILIATDNLFVQILNALFFSFVMLQAGFLGHDFSHGQVLEQKSLNRFFGSGIWGLLLGGSEIAWYNRHNAHHEHVNQNGRDPDINIPFLFKEGQEPGTFSFNPYLLKYQHILFFVSLPVWYISQLISTWGDHPRLFLSFRGGIEVILAIIHFVVLFVLVFSFLPVLVGIVFLIVHVGAASFYMGVAFAPNHKGEEIHAADSEVTWLEQITSTRNLFPSFFLFHIFGGLNYQVEHHLFPGVSRYQYPHIQKLVKQFCLDNNIRYHQTSWLGSMKEIYVALKIEAERLTAIQ